MQLAKLENLNVIQIVIYFIALNDSMLLFQNFDIWGIYI